MQRKVISSREKEKPRPREMLIHRHNHQIQLDLDPFHSQTHLMNPSLLHVRRCHPPFVDVVPTITHVVREGKC